MKKNKFTKIINGFIYIHYYHKQVSNKLLVIGVLRKIFKFKLFWYFELKKLQQ